MMQRFDPTAIKITSDPTLKIMRGTTFWGMHDFEVPLVSHIKDNLWTGGCEDGLLLPENIQHVISLYPWERYMIQHKIRSESYQFMYDSNDIDEAVLDRIVAYAVACVKDAPTLIHCQAGLNRSALVAAQVMQLAYGNSIAYAIKTLREKRSPAVLCNPHFVAYLESK